MRRDFAARGLLRRLLSASAAAALIVAVHACVEDDPTRPARPEVSCSTSPDIAAGIPPAVYFLAFANGASLPLILEQHTRVLDSGSMTLNADSTFTFVSYTRLRHDISHGDSGVTIAHVVGRYSRCGATIHFNSNPILDFAATIRGTTFTVVAPVAAVSPGASGHTYSLVYSQNVREVICGSADAGPDITSGAYGLLTVDSAAPPVILPNGYPYLITLASATATIVGDKYKLVGRGSVDLPDSTDVEVFADSGRVLSCPGFVQFVSTVHDSSFTGSTKPTTLKIRLPASFVNFEYDFFGGDPVVLVLSKSP